MKPFQRKMLVVANALLVLAGIFFIWMGVLIKRSDFDRPLPAPEAVNAEVMQISDVKKLRSMVLARDTDIRLAEMMIDQARRIPFYVALMAVFLGGLNLILITTGLPHGQR